jgi:hypothetical protein
MLDRARQKNRRRENFGSAKNVARGVFDGKFAANPGSGGCRAQAMFFVPMN